jgi:glycosyltransferase involved in cell wall biosynthesis
MVRPRPILTRRKPRSGVHFITAYDSHTLSRSFRVRRPQVRHLHRVSAEPPGRCSMSDPNRSSTHEPADLKRSFGQLLSDERHVSGGTRTLTVVTVGYPLSALGPDAVGGAEQIASTIESAVVGAGHRSVVIAPGDSVCRGTLVPLPVPSAPFDHQAICDAHRACREAIAMTLAREQVDILHMHGTDFALYLPAGHRAIATLHRWPDCYPDSLLRDPGNLLTLQCVSEAQRRACPMPARTVVIPNGVDTSRWMPTGATRSGAVFIGRICHEKGVHLAIEAAERAGIPLTIAGIVFPYATHMDYFNRSVVPRLNRRVSFVGGVAGHEKRDLLASAACVIVPSTVPETSSLVVMEALSSGTPIVALSSPAFQELIEHGRTGFLVRDVAEMAEALTRVGEISPDVCRSLAVSRFSAARMTRQYLALYEAVFDANRPTRSAARSFNEWTTSVSASGL